jgi:hypothetical protein
MGWLTSGGNHPMLNTPGLIAIWSSWLLWLSLFVLFRDLYKSSEQGVHQFRYVSEQTTFYFDLDSPTMNGGCPL